MLCNAADVCTFGRVYFCSCGKQLSGPRVSICVYLWGRSKLIATAFSSRMWYLVAEWLTVYPKKYAHGVVVLCFVVVMQSFIMNSHEVFIHIHQGCFAGTVAIVRLPQCQWSKPDGYGKISQCITTTKHSKAKTVCIFLEIYCMIWPVPVNCTYGENHSWPIYGPTDEGINNVSKLQLLCLYWVCWLHHHYVDALNQRSQDINDINASISHMMIVIITNIQLLGM